MNQSSTNLTVVHDPEPNAWKPWLVASLAALVILGIAIGLMALLGLFNAPKDDTGAKSLAAALGLVGAVLSAVVVLVGTIIKYSMDDRSARQAAIDARHNHELAVQAEQRNRIEAAIRAVDLLSENNQDATQSQMGGALLALVSLGEVELAVSLLAPLWRIRKVTPDVADVVLRNAMKSTSEETQIMAAAALLRNASQIDLGVANIWPLMKLWDKSLNENSRLGLAQAAAEWLISLGADDPIKWRDPSHVLYLALHDKFVGYIAAECLRPIVKASAEDDVLLIVEGVGITVAEIQQSLRSLGFADEAPDGTFEKRLNKMYAPLIAAKQAAKPLKQP